jgi:hypothetical protein
MTHLLDARRLVDEFSRSDARLPAVVFALLGIYFVRGPFEFHPRNLTDELGQINSGLHLNPQELAALQMDLERFFVATADGWRPRQDFLAAAETGTSTHMTGDLSTPTHA